MKKVIFFIISFVIFSCNTTTKNNSAISILSPTEFNLQHKNYTLVDIRTPQEYQEGHIENAVNINFYDQNFLSHFENFNKSEPIFIYCRSGNRTSKASVKLAEMGFAEVYDLKGGINNWRKENLKVVN